MGNRVTNIDVLWSSIVMQRIAPDLSGLKQYFAITSHVSVLTGLRSHLDSLRQLHSDSGWGCCHLKARLSWTSHVAHSQSSLYGLSAGSSAGLLTGASIQGFSMYVAFPEFRSWAPGGSIPSEHSKRPRQKLGGFLSFSLGSLRTPLPCIVLSGKSPKPAHITGEGNRLHLSIWGS